jgi:hypothetical protein
MRSVCWFFLVDLAEKEEQGLVNFSLDLAGYFFKVG